MTNDGYVSNIYKSNIVYLKMNCNLTQMMKFYKIILNKIIFIEKRYIKLKIVALYVMINDGENKMEQIKNHLNKKMMIMFGMK